MTALAARLAARIRATGPITMADYMAACLTDPAHGYYVTRDPLGRGGDFITAPEISQIFGECLGLSLAACWAAAGCPAQATLAELGPGRGTLMADALRAGRRVPGFREAARVHLVEVSPELRARQAETLAGESPVWHDSVAGLPEAPLFLLANEFLDALPVRQFVRAGDAWAERMVGEDGGRLCPGLSPPAPLADLADRLGDVPEGGVVERMPALAGIVGAVAARIVAHGGAAIFVDYGDWRSLGDTLQAVKGHAAADPFEAPGTADLTAHVDFEAVARAALAAGAVVTEMTTQGVLLERLGITARAQVLARGLAGPALDDLVAAHRRLTHPEEMGTLFKAIAIHSPGLSPPPGFT